ncbi:MAG: regulatory iron-sulfur-containing complex subunit RicT [Chitinophagales bacterium]|nr:regulatory iron-sulfur-containing complex subunit RicT [Chitinophagales bacterium]
MACAGCTTSGTTPKGCGSKGHCASGACNMLNTFDWLAEMPIAFGSEQVYVHEISFQKGSRKDFFKNDKKLEVETGDWVVVETSMGTDIGQITLSGELVKLQMRKKKVKEKPAELRSIIRKAEEHDFKVWEEAKALEKETMIRARAVARSLSLDMKVGHVEYQADKKKATFYYTADDRVDFRELIKIYAKEFKVKIEMRQIGARQEAGKIGGIGSCGRELCCSTWLTDFKSVSTNAARYQNLSINMAKLSGQCGRLKCCLNYELDTYMDALQDFPKKADKIDTENGKAFLQKTDILQRLMWYTYEDSSNFYPLSVEKVKEILEMNEAGKPAPPLGYIAVHTAEEEEEVAVDYEDTVGHITLAALEKTGKKKKRKNKNKNRPQGEGTSQNAQQRTTANNSPNQPQQQQQQGQGNNQQRQGAGGGNRRNKNRNRNRGPKPQGS